MHHEDNHEGIRRKTVYLRPTGNEARYNKGKILEAIMTKVARVYATVTIGDRKYTEKLRMRGNHLSDQCNGGYLVYASKQELEDQLLVEDIAEKKHRKKKLPNWPPRNARSRNRPGR